MTRRNRFHTSRDCISHAWEYQGAIYLPSFSYLYGCLGYTVELPHSNVDSYEAGKYNVYMQTSANSTDPGQYGIAKYKGFARKEDPDNPGEKLNRFPDYLVLPSTAETQLNVAEAIKAVEFAMRHGAKASAITVPVTYDGFTYPAGSYVFDMKQAHRNFISEILRPGDDYTFLPSSYADIYADYPTRS